MKYITAGQPWLIVKPGMVGLNLYFDERLPGNPIRQLKKYLSELSSFAHYDSLNASLPYVMGGGRRGNCGKMGETESDLHAVPRHPKGADLGMECSAHPSIQLLQGQLSKHLLRM